MDEPEFLEGDFAIVLSVEGRRGIIMSPAGANEGVVLRFEGLTGQADEAEGVVFLTPDLAAKAIHLLTVGLENLGKGHLL
jgi:hypothetical protein